MRTTTTVTLWLLLGCSAFAQVTTSPSGRVLPSVDVIGTVPLNSKLEVEVQRQADSDKLLGSTTYFHTPAFVILERDATCDPRTTALPNSSDVPFTKEELEKLPPAVHCGFKRGTTTFLQFEFLLTNEAIQKRVASVALLNDAAFRAREKSSAADAIKTAPWPVVSVTATVRDSVERKAIATWQSGIISDTNQFDQKLTANVAFDSQKLADFLNRAAVGQVEFAFDYTFTNAVVQFVEASQGAVVDARKAVGELLSSSNAVQANVIFQDRVEQVRKDIGARVQVAVVTNMPGSSYKDFLGAVQSNIMGDFLRQEKIDLASESDPALVAAMNTYIVAVVDKFRDFRKETETRGDTSKGTTKVGLGIKYAGVGFEVNDEDVSTSEIKHGVEWGWDSTKTIRVPTTVTVHRVDLSGASVSFSALYRLAQGVSYNAAALKSAVRPMSFNIKALDLGDDVESVPFASILPGMGLCYFGSGDIPRGYVELDGTKQWPNEDWVPSALKGKPTVDAVGTLLAIGPKAAVGTVSRNGQVRVPAQTLDKGAISGAEDGVGAVYKNATFGTPDTADTSESGGGQVTKGQSFKLSDRDDVAASAKELGVSVAGGTIMFPLPNALIVKPDSKLAIPAQDLVMSSLSQAPPHLSCRMIVRTTD